MHGRGHSCGQHAGTRSCARGWVGRSRFGGGCVSAFQGGVGGGLMEAAGLSWAEERV
jgi:hypothetical protein